VQGAITAWHTFSLLLARERQHVAQLRQAAAERSRGAAVSRGLFEAELAEAAPETHPAIEQELAALRASEELASTQLADCLEALLDFEFRLFVFLRILLCYLLVSVRHDKVPERGSTVYCDFEAGRDAAGLQVDAGASLDSFERMPPKLVFSEERVRALTVAQLAAFAQKTSHMLSVCVAMHASWAALSAKFKAPPNTIRVSTLTRRELPRAADNLGDAYVESRERRVLLREELAAARQRAARPAARQRPASAGEQPLKKPRADAVALLRSGLRRFAL